MPAAERLRDSCCDSGIGGAGLVVDASRPTVEKVRIVTDRNQQVARVDYERDADVERRRRTRTAAADRATGQSSAPALLVSDYLKGTITDGVDGGRCVALKNGRRAAARRPEDSASRSLCRRDAGDAEPSRGGDRDASPHPDRRGRARRSARRSGRGRSATACSSRAANRGCGCRAPDAEGAIPAVAREVSDVTGAGDTVVATLALALAAGATHGRSGGARQSRRRDRRRQVRSGDGDASRSCSSGSTFEASALRLVSVGSAAGR